jgi:hypothetical protein
MLPHLVDPVPVDEGMESGVASHRVASAEDVELQDRIARRMHVALTDLYAYLLVLDSERERLEDRALALPRSQGPQRAELFRRAAEIGEELEALRRASLALRAETDIDRLTL